MAYKLSTSQPAIMFADNSKMKYKYVTFDGKQKQEIEVTSASMAKILGCILKRSYITGLEKLKGNNITMSQLDDYDTQIWESHISKLDDGKYLKKILLSLNIQIHL